MNQKIKIAMLLAVSILVSIGLYAQLTSVKKEKEGLKLPRWVSELGYWVVESNIHSPKTHTVWFYNNDNELMYKETLEGIKLNAEKPRIKMKLKKALETSAIAWQNSKKGLTPHIGDDRSLVISLLR